MLRLIRSFQDFDLSISRVCTRHGSDGALFCFCSPAVSVDFAGSEIDETVKVKLIFDYFRGHVDSFMKEVRQTTGVLTNI